MGSSFYSPETERKKEDLPLSSDAGSQLRPGPVECMEPRRTVCVQVHIRLRGLLLLLPMRVGKLLIGYSYPESPEPQVLSS